MGMSRPCGRAVKAIHAFLLGVTTAAGALSTPPASAQTAPAATEPADSLSEIVVTAEKRDSTVLKTPASITAISGPELEAAGITSFATVAAETPGISIRSSGPGQNEIEMRGLTSSGGAAPTVGFYLDEVPLSPPAGANNGKVVIDPDLYDLDRVEALRGPQGTLYGSGSMGGTVKLVTAQPKLDEVSGSIEVTGSHTQGANDNGSINVMLNLPLAADTVALRIVGTEQHTSGWIDRVVLSNFPLEAGYSPTAPAGSVITLPRGNVLASPVSTTYHNVNDEYLDGFRISLLVKLSDDLTITPSYFYQSITQGGYDTYDDPPGTSVPTLAHYQPVDTPEPFEDEFTIGSVVVRDHFGWADLTFASSVWNREENQTMDLSEDFQALTQLNFFLPSPLTEIDISHQWSEELRLASNGSDPLQWLVGGYYSQFRSEFQQIANDPAWDPYIGFSNLINEAQPQHIRQAAFFGNVSYQINPEFKATAGLRYYNYHSTMSVSDTGLFASGNATQAFTIYDSQQNSGVTPMASVAYTPTNDLTLYANVAKGFRPGGGNQYVPVSGPASCLSSLQQFGQNSAPNTYGPDTVWSYEVGEKARALDGRLSVNSSVYYESWRSIQLQVPLPCGFFYTANAEKAGVYGTEIEVQAKLAAPLTLSVNGGYTHSTYGEDSPETGFMEGERVPDVPLYTAGLVLSYDAPLVDRYRLLGRIDDSHVGPIVDYTFAQNNLPGHNIANARVGLAWDRITGWLFVNNLADTRAELSDTNSLGANGAFLNRVATNQPRTIGITLGYKF
jgi:outer membrane receptor protein involved in Fe transport